MRCRASELQLVRSESESETYCLLQPNRALFGSFSVYHSGEGNVPQRRKTDGCQKLDTQVHPRLCSHNICTPSPQYPCSSPSSNHGLHVALRPFFSLAGVIQYVQNRRGSLTGVATPVGECFEDEQHSWRVKDLEEVAELARLSAPCPAVEGEGASRGDLTRDCERVGLLAFANSTGRRPITRRGGAEGVTRGGALRGVEAAASRYPKSSSSTDGMLENRTPLGFFRQGAGRASVWDLFVILEVLFVGESPPLRPRRW